MTRTTFAALLSHWRMRPGQLLAVILGLALATALWTGVQAINAEARASYQAAAGSLGRSEIQRLHADGSSIPQAQYIALRRAGWLVSPVLEGTIRVGDNRIRAYGYDPLTAPLATQAVDLTDTNVLASFMSGSIGFAHPETVGKLDADLIGLELRVDPSIPLGLLLLDIGAAQRLLEKPNSLSHLTIWPDQPSDLPPLSEIAPGLKIGSLAANAEVSRLTDSFHLNLTAFGLLSFVVGLFIVHATIGLAFEQRRQMFRTLRALGLPIRQLITLLAAEIAFLAFVSGALGVALGYLIASTLLPGVAATLRGLYGAEIAGTLALRPSWWLSGLGIAFLGAAIAASQSLWRVVNLPLLAPVQPRAWMRASMTGYRLQFGLSILCLAIAFVAWAFFSGLLAGLVLLGAVLLGAALSLPLFLTLALRLASGFSKGTVSTWFWADTQQQLPGLSLALMAMMLALAANVGVGTMVSSFRLTFTGWLDQRLAAELYVTGRDQAEADALRDFLFERADAVLPIWRVERTHPSGPLEIFAVADHETYRNNWPLLVSVDGVWDSLANGNGILINEQLWRRSKLELDALFHMPNGPSLPIIGVYSDYGNPKPQIMIGLRLFELLYPDAAKLGYAVRTTPDSVPALQAELSAAFELPERLMVDQAQIKAFSLGVFERTFSVSAALNVLTLGVAAFAMLMSLLTLAGMRLPQLAPVWALGLTRRQLALLELGRAAMLAILTTIIAIPVGLVLAWCLLAVVNVEAFGWRLPMFLFPAQWLVLGGLALLAAVLAALLPARKLAKTLPGELLKVFANER